MSNWRKIENEKPLGSGWYFVYDGKIVQPAFYWDTQEMFDTGDENDVGATHWQPLVLPSAPLKK